MATINVGSSPNFATYDSGNGYVYVTNYNSANVSVINGTTLVGSVNVGGYPKSPAYDSRNGYVYVPNDGSSNVSVINGLTVVGSVNVGNYPDSATYDSANGYVYIPNFFSSNVSVISGLTVVKSVNVGSGPDSATYDSGNGYVYVTNEGAYPTVGTNVSVINGVNLVGSVNVGSNPTSAVYDGGNGYVYVVNKGTNNVSVISGTSLVSPGSAKVGSSPTSAAYDSGNGDVYVTNYGAYPITGTNVSVIHGVTAVGSAHVGNNPDFAAYNNGNGYVYVANAGSNNVSVINGTKAVASVNVGSYPASATYDNGNGNVYVTNTNTNNVSVILTGYTVTFTEAGLPTGKGWLVTLNGSQQNSMSMSMAFAKPNGTFAFTVGAPTGYAASPSSGSVTVSGASKSISVTFTLRTYVVTFTESGLPTGTEWWVNVTGGPSTSSSTTFLSFSESNGTYAYSLATVDKTYSSPGGAFPVSGVAAFETVAFSRVTYSVTFAQSGLASGTAWSVTLNGVTQSGMTGGIVFTGLANGTYGFTIGSVAGYNVTFGAGSITLNGSPGFLLIMFTSLSSPPPTILGLPATEGYAVLGGVVAAIIVGAVAIALLWWRRGKAPPGPAKPPVPPGVG